MLEYFTMYYYNTRAHPGSIWPWIPLPDESWRGIPIAPFLLCNLLFTVLLTAWSFAATFFNNNTEFYLSTAIGIFMTYIFIESIIHYHRAQLTKLFIFPVALLGSCLWMFVFLVVSIVGTSAVAWGGDRSNFRVDQTLLALAAYAAFNTMSGLIVGLLELVYVMFGKRPKNKKHMLLV